MENILQSIKELLQEELTPIKNEIKTINQRLGQMEPQLEENTQMLRSLVHSSETHKADIDNLTHQVANVSGEIKSLRADVTFVEEATGKNIADIAVLKRAK
ncbi:hypothetical protein [Petroclostridium sp. X23]|uniref:hypothetical protein n=1 Tax=Petroclostridium sp. X23 TaxID=3045146 RepID=UPI0024AE5522|nr:hypothetical protein [Petroclostridium sp. X23]WHH58272.1 hypothetical protein QKW49_21110 [Petroclostridium sp. X23]